MIIQMSEYRAMPGRLAKTGVQAAARTGAAAAVVWMNTRTRKEADRRLAEDAAIADVEALLDRIYALATQI